MTCYGGPTDINDRSPKPPPTTYPTTSWFTRPSVFAKSNGLGGLNTLWSPKSRRLLQKPAAQPDEDQPLLAAFGELVQKIETQGMDCPVNSRGAVSPALGENKAVQLTEFDVAPHLDKATYCNFVSLPSIMKVLPCRACACCSSAAA